jgi:hypothetical protein
MSRQLTPKSNLKIHGYSFEQVKEFKYLGVNINEENSMHEEIKIRLMMANKSYYAMKEMFTSKLLLRRTKERLYITYLRPIATYACETWASTKDGEAKLAIFERKILRRIYGPVFNANLGIFERRKNEDLQKLYNKPNICKFLSNKILEWAGHVWRVEGCLIRKVLDGKLNGKRSIGRPRQRWFDTVKKDLTRVDPTYNINLAVDRMHWRGIVEAALDLNGLF